MMDFPKKEASVDVGLSSVPKWVAIPFFHRFPPGGGAVNTDMIYTRKNAY